MEEATGAPSSFAVWDPKRLRASGRDGERVMNRPPSFLTMLLSRHTKRREFITLLGGAAAWPLAARAQQPSERMRRIGVLMTSPRTTRKRRPASRHSCKGCSESGWTVGRNVRIDYRWGAGDAAAHPQIRGGIGRARAGRHPRPRRRRTAAAAAAGYAAPCRVVFATASTRLALASSIVWRGRAATSPASFSSNTAWRGKWLELLKKLRPASTRVAVLREPGNCRGSDSWP